MDTQTFNKYAAQLSQLGRNRQNTSKAPHKPILLLSLFEEIRRNNIQNNKIQLTDELVAAFIENWQTLPLPPGNWRKRIWLPFFYLSSDGFWDLHKDNNLKDRKEIGEPYSVEDLRSRIDYASLKPDLWQLLQDDVALDGLRSHLFETYFSLAVSDVQPPQSVNPIVRQLEKLVAEAEAKPRSRTVREHKDDTDYYIRHSLFPQIVRTVYGKKCAVCGLSAEIDKKSVIEAAHIKPFASHHNDSPSNGIALCTNHHWAFDAGGFGIRNDYTVTVSDKLDATYGYLLQGTPIRLPTSSNCYPSKDALSWHRDKWALK